jgi:hypothetical protein
MRKYGLLVAAAFLVAAAPTAAVAQYTQQETYDKIVAEGEKRDYVWGYLAINYSYWDSHADTFVTRQSQWSNVSGGATMAQIIEFGDYCDEFLAAVLKAIAAQEVVEPALAFLNYEFDETVEYYFAQEYNDVFSMYADAPWSNALSVGNSGNSDMHDAILEMAAANQKMLDLINRI